MGNFNVEELAEKLYDLDVNVYEATASKMGRVFPAGKEISVKKMVKKLNGDKRHFIRDETTLISNMISTIRDPKLAAEYKDELNNLKVMLDEFSPVKILPDSFSSNISSMKSRFNENGHKILCIGREYGSGGHEVGYRLSEKLGMSYYDNEIIKMACEHIGKDFTGDDMANTDGKHSHFSKNPLRFRKFPGNDELFFAQSDMIEKLAAEEDCIFLGRCADVVLEHAGIPRISVFIGAPFDERVKHDMACTGINHDDAVDRVRNMDRARKAYYNYYTGRHWGHSENYDMCINTACYGVDGTVEVLEKMFKMF